MHTFSHMLDDFFIQMLILIGICIAVLFLFDVLIDPFKLNENCQKTE